MASPDFSNTAIVACGTMSPELKHLQAEGFLKAGKIIYTTPGLHQNCPSWSASSARRCKGPPRITSG